MNGVSTRKIERLAKSLGIESISASQVSLINKELNEQVEEFRSRLLKDTYLVIWIDSLYEKIRDNNRVCNMAVHVVCGVNLDGQREILAVEPMYEESEASYTVLFDSLKNVVCKKYCLLFPMPIKAWSLLSKILCGLQLATV